MSEEARPEPGSVGWFDLTVDKADEIRDFYGEVAGWKADPVDMKGYRDYAMTTPEGHAVAGICHARGVNADLPPRWLIYITVTDLDRSTARCLELGGTVLAPPRSLAGHGRMCVIEDPAGAVAALFEPTVKV
jgi:predicted enzyme related to lactoylglutathione lyase